MTTQGFNRVSVVGLGYIGLPTASMLASRSLSVIGVDVSERVVKAISSGHSHFSEPDLDMLLQSSVSTERLKAVLAPEPADAFIIAVPTPTSHNHDADMSYVQAAVTAVAKVLKPGNLVILESTSPIGTTRQMCNWIAAARPDLTLPHTNPGNADVHIAYCPERILPGRMLLELVENDRIIGGMTIKCAQRAADLYRTFVRGELMMTTPETAELVKLMENAYRDVNIAFANEISMLCEPHNIDPWEAISLANRHPRVRILNPGPGVGGHCIAVDPYFLISTDPAKTPLMRSAREVNEHKPIFVMEKCRKQISRFRDPVVATLGLAYKADIDDLRESPSLKIVELLAADGEAKILVVEPNLTELPESLQAFDNVEFADLESALERADIIVLLVGHRQFAEVNVRSIYERIVIDTVGLWRPQRSS